MRLNLPALSALSALAAAFRGARKPENPAPAPARRVDMPAAVAMRAEWDRQRALSLAADVRHALACYAQAKADYAVRPNRWRAVTLHQTARRVAFYRELMLAAADSYRATVAQWGVPS